MRIVDPGHQYELDHLDGEFYELLTFVKREGEGYPGNCGSYPGTNIQEVLRALIDRVKYLDRQAKCIENKWILRNLRDSLRFLEERAARRHWRRPDWRLYEKDGTTNDQIEHLPTCAVCGHIGCESTAHITQQFGERPDTPSLQSSGRVAKENEGY